jgi:hypothetical protein
VILIPADQLDSRWEWVRAGLDALIAKCNESWHPSDVYAAIHSGRAFLYQIADGFVVLQMQQTWGRTELFVWILYAPHDMKPRREEVFTELQQMARRMGARAIVMKSPRKGWERVGFKVKEITYEWPV